jgi:Transposase DDE domain group 1
MIRARIFAIACGYEDCNDFGPLRADPAFKLACGHLPETGTDLASQPILSRLENAPSLRDAIRLTYALVDQWMESYATPPDGVVLDIDDTCDVVHGHQQLSLFNAHYDERCFLPIHVYDSATGRPVAIVLRPGKTPSGVEVRAHLRRLVRRIRARWPLTRITIRGDSHYARPEVMDFCEQNGLSYLFGLARSRPLTTKVQEVADAVRTQRAVEDREVVRGFAETTHRANVTSESVNGYPATIAKSFLDCSRTPTRASAHDGTASALTGTARRRWHDPGTKLPTCACRCRIPWRRRWMPRGSPRSRLSWLVTVRA